MIVYHRRWLYILTSGTEVVSCSPSPLAAPTIRSGANEKDSRGVEGLHGRDRSRSGGRTKL